MLLILQVEEMFSAVKTEPYCYVPVSLIIPCGHQTSTVT